MTDGAARKKPESLPALLAGATAQVAEALRSLVDRDVQARPGELRRCEPAELAAALTAQAIVVRGALDTGATLRFLIPAGEAVALAGYMMMTPEEVVAERRARGVIDGDELEAFGDIANVLCSTLDTMLKEQVGRSLRVQGHDVVARGKDLGALGSEALQAFSFKLRVGPGPEATAWLLLDTPTAAAWGGPKERAAEESEEDIPAAPIRGKLAAFATSAEALAVVRKACRRAGLELGRHAKNDIPNPAAHKGQVLVLEIPGGEERRFDWCKRLKHFSDSIKVVLLIHYPSRQRVLQGALVQADAILGWPVSDELLAQKLDALLTPAAPPAD